MDIQHSSQLVPGGTNLWTAKLPAGLTRLAVKAVKGMVNKIKETMDYECPCAIQVQRHLQMTAVNRNIIREEEWEMKVPAHSGKSLRTRTT